MDVAGAIIKAVEGFQDDPRYEYGWQQSLRSGKPISAGGKPMIELGRPEEQAAYFINRAHRFGRPQLTESLDCDMVSVPADLSNAVCTDHYERYVVTCQSLTGRWPMFYTLDQNANRRLNIRPDSPLLRCTLRFAKYHRPTPTDPKQWSTWLDGKEWDTINGWPSWDQTDDQAWQHGDDWNGPGTDQAVCPNVVQPRAWARWLGTG